MSAEAVKTLVQAFISCRLDYCNSLFYGITEGLMSRLQCVQNAAARLVSGARRYDHITPVLQELYWLPVRRLRWISRWPPWSTCHSPVWLQPTWWPTASWSPTKVVVSCASEYTDVKKSERRLTRSCIGCFIGIWQQWASEG